LKRDVESLKGDIKSVDKKIDQQFEKLNQKMDQKFVAVNVARRLGSPRAVCTATFIEKIDEKFDEKFPAFQQRMSFMAISLGITAIRAAVATMFWRTSLRASYSTQQDAQASPLSLGPLRPITLRMAVHVLTLIGKQKYRLCCSSFNSYLFNMSFTVKMGVVSGSSRRNPSLRKFTRKKEQRNHSFCLFPFLN